MRAARGASGRSVDRGVVRLVRGPVRLWNRGDLSFAEQLAAPRSEQRALAVELHDRMCAPMEYQHRAACGDGYRRHLDEIPGARHTSRTGRRRRPFYECVGKGRAVGRVAAASLFAVRPLACGDGEHANHQYALEDVHRMLLAETTGGIIAAFAFSGVIG